MNYFPDIQVISKCTPLNLSKTIINAIVDWFNNKDSSLSVLFMNGGGFSTWLKLDSIVHISFGNSFTRQETAKTINNSGNIKLEFIELLVAHPDLSKQNPYLIKMKKKFIEILFLWKYTYLDKNIITDVYAEIGKIIKLLMFDDMTNIALFLRWYLNEMVM